MVERRNAGRFPVHGQGWAIFSALRRGVILLELSTRGALVAPVPMYDMEGFVPAARCTLRFLTPRGFDALAVAAIVTRYSEDGLIGLELRGTSSITDQMLRQLIESHRESEVTLHANLKVRWEDRMFRRMRERARFTEWHAFAAGRQAPRALTLACLNPRAAASDGVGTARKSTGPAGVSGQDLEVRSDGSCAASSAPAWPKSRKGFRPA